MPKSISRSTNDRFVFRKNANIGAADAIQDETFLFESFVDTGDIDTLKDTRNPKSIVVGRTGAGKTALLEYLRKNEERTVRIDVADLALSYISNNTVIRFFSDLGVNLDLFYKLLWRHVLAVEVIRKHYKIIDEETNASVLRQIRERISKNRKTQEAFEYFTKYETSFWKETDQRIKELTRRTEHELSNSANIAAKAGVSKANIEAGIETGNKELLTQEEKSAVYERGQEVINRVQMAELTRIIEMISEELTDEQKKYYITIDRLDEDWVDDGLRYKLIRALIETVRDFNSRIRNLKIILALREDLIERVFRYTRDSGQQEEKYQSMNLHVKWDKDYLVELLDKRVNQLIREQYTKQDINLRSILPIRVTKKEEDPIDYMINRTMMRPRDAIMFFNECIEAAQGKPTINKQRFLDAEASYSQKRLNALRDEWSTDYPNLIKFCLCLKKFPNTFRIREVKDKFEENILDFLTSTDSDIRRDGYLYRMSEEKYNRGDVIGIIDEGLRVFYKVGVVGVKAETYLSTSWSYLGQKVLSTNDESTVHIHPMFWRVLGIEP